MSRRKRKTVDFLDAMRELREELARDGIIVNAEEWLRELEADREAAREAESDTATKRDEVTGERARGPRTGYTRSGYGCAVDGEIARETW